MSVRTTAITVAVVAALGVAALLVAAAADERSSAFSLDVPPDEPVARIGIGQEVCQGPFEAAVSFGSVTAWIQPTGDVGASLQLQVRSAGGATLASGQTAQGYDRLVARTFALDTPVAAGRRISVCFRSEGPERVALFGAGARSRVQLTEVGSLRPAARSRSGVAAIALVFTRRHPRSLLSLFPTIFKRAAVFRPSWVGPWTFWALVAGVLAAFLLAGVATTRAVRSDSRR